jgi:hypothetical protein
VREKWLFSIKFCPPIAGPVKKSSPFLGFAALDVIEQQALPSDSILRQMSNLILSPHIARYFGEAVGELDFKDAEIAAKLMTGQWVNTILNPQVKPLAENRWRAYPWLCQGYHYAE